MTELTKDQALALSKTEWWKNKTPHEITEFQLFQDRLCMPFGDFHLAVEKALGRPVWTHEFAKAERLRKEFLGERAAPTLEQILEQIPEAKRIVVAIP